MAIVKKLFSLDESIENGTMKVYDSEDVYKELGIEKRYL
jgi:hypothetical protein